MRKKSIAAGCIVPTLRKARRMGHPPAPQVFMTRLDSAKTRVYSRQTGLLVPTDPNLETQVRQEAERQLLEAAMADGILRNAQVNAASTIRSLLQGLEFEQIELE